MVRQYLKVSIKLKIEFWILSILSKSIDEFWFFPIFSKNITRKRSTNSLFHCSARSGGWRGKKVGKRMKASWKRDGVTTKKIKLEYGAWGSVTKPEARIIRCSARRFLFTYYPYMSKWKEIKRHRRIRYIICSRLQRIKRDSVVTFSPDSTAHFQITQGTPPVHFQITQKKGRAAMALSSLQMVLVLILAFCSIWVSLAYERPKPRETLSVPLADDADGLTPQQVLLYIWSIPLTLRLEY